VVVEVLVNGLSVGNIYALIAAGVALVFGVAQLINFAHGSVYMMGAYAGWFLTAKVGLPLYIALPAAIVFSSLLGIVIERVAVRPFEKSARIAPLLATVGIALILDQGAQFVYGPFTQAFSHPIQDIWYQWGVISIGALDIVIAVVSLTTGLTLFLFLKYAKLGRALRATAQDADAARQVGVDVERANRIAFAVAGGLAGLAGALVGLYYNSVYPSMGSLAGLKGFTAAVLGGVGSIPGAIAGGYLLGLIESVGVSLFGANYRNLFAFAILVLVLLLKPNGIFRKGSSLPKEPMTGTFIPHGTAFALPRWAPPLLLGLAVAIPFIAPDPYLLQVLGNAWVLSIAVAGLTIVTGNIGLSSLGSASMMAVGAYASALLTLSLALPFWASLLAGGLIASALGTAILYPTFRLSGPYFAIATIGIGEVVAQTILNWDGLTRGALGLTNIPPPSFGSFRVVTPRSSYYLALALLAVVVFLFRRIQVSFIGRRFRAIRDDQTAARSFGIHSARYKAIAFALSGFAAGLAGALTAHQYSYVNHETFNANTSTLLLTMVIVGGLGNVWGAILGTVLLTAVPELLRFVSDYRWILYGLALIVVLRFKPRGILGTV
jgi:branched-chain amino acid transport system permease protein